MVENVEFHRNADCLDSRHWLNWSFFLVEKTVHGIHGFHTLPFEFIWHYSIGSTITSWKQIFVSQRYVQFEVTGENLTGEKWPFHFLTLPSSKTFTLGVTPQHIVPCRISRAHLLNRAHAWFNEWWKTGKKNPILQILCEICMDVRVNVWKPWFITAVKLNFCFNSC